MKGPPSTGAQNLLAAADSGRHDPGLGGGGAHGGQQPVLGHFERHGDMFLFVAEGPCHAASPYLITVDKATQQVLSISRTLYPAWPKARRIPWLPSSAF